MNQKAKTVEEYISNYPKDVQSILQKIRSIITNCSPNSIESISYGMPAYKLNKKPLVYYAAYDKHIGFYATPNGHEAFKKELSIYKQGKGSVQFPLNEDIPYDLIERIVKYRVEQNRG
ncbi:MAG: DUF1801 domain-containing protein [Crocinitomicaceae bacterium]|nr:DUF1801 domain-containing protein [Crocinitomicaceae bacterium]